MSSQLALWIGALGIFWLLVRDVRRRRGLSGALWLVVLWVVMIGSRSVSTWFNFSGVGMNVEAYDTGNPIERVVYFVFIAVGALVLSRRNVQLKDFLRENGWLVCFYGFWLCSVLWAESPLIAFKRWFKELGNLVMVLIVLTERQPVEAAKAVFIRCACLLIPLSAIFIKYIPELGRTYHVWSGAMMYTGVATHKNTLGVLALVSAIFLLWDLLDRLRYLPNPRWIELLPEGGLFFLSLWALFTSHSATSRFCFVIGAGLLLLVRTEFIRRRMHLFVRTSVFGAATLLILDMALGLREAITTIVLRILERDPTFTGRTDAWVMLVKEVDNPLVGAGFNSFWSGERMQRVWENYEIIQAHSGYVETYLNGGILGLALLGALLFATGMRIKESLYRDNPAAGLRFVFWLIAIIYNFSEASFCKLGLLWYVVLLMITELPRRPRLAERATTYANMQRAAPAGRRRRHRAPEVVAASYHPE